jgi:hypothetical protein
LDPFFGHSSLCITTIGHLSHGIFSFSTHF